MHPGSWSATHIPTPSADPFNTHPFSSSQGPPAQSKTNTSDKQHQYARHLGGWLYPVALRGGGLILSLPAGWRRAQRLRGHKGSLHGGLGGRGGLVVKAVVAAVRVRARESERVACRACNTHTHTSALAQGVVARSTTRLWNQRGVPSEMWETKDIRAPLPRKQPFSCYHLQSC